MIALDRAKRSLIPLLLLGITLLGAGLRIFAIGEKGIWLDEAFSVWLGWHRLPEMWGWIARIDQHPPFYYTILNVWMRLGDDAATVRLLSAVFSTLTIPVTFLLGRRLAGVRVGLLAALLLAISPFHVRFAQEARMYALLALAASASMACLAYLLSEAAPVSSGALAGHPSSSPASEASRHRRWGGSSLSWLCRAGDRAEALGTTARRAASHHGLAWAGYVVFTAAAMLTHSSALLLLVSTNLFVFGLIWWRARRLPARRSPSGNGLHPPSLGTWVVAQACVLFLWGVIWLPAFVEQAAGVYREFWLPAPTWRTLVDMLGNFLSAYLPRLRWPWIDLVWVVYLALLGLGIAKLRSRPAVLGLLVTLFVTPVIGELLVSVQRPVFYERTLIWVTIPLYVLLAAGITALRRWPYMLSVLVIAIAANGLSLPEYYFHFQKEGWQEAVAYVSRQAGEGDLILFNASWSQLPFDFYYRESSARAEEHGLPVDLFEAGVLEPKMEVQDLPRLHELLRNRERVWLVYSHNWYTDPRGLIPQALSQELTLLDRQDYQGLEIQRYERTAGYPLR
jgi:mannosyltransferase